MLRRNTQIEKENLIFFINLFPAREPLSRGRRILNFNLTEMKHKFIAIIMNRIIIVESIIIPIVNAVRECHEKSIVNALNKVEVLIRAHTFYSSPTISLARENGRGINYV